MKVVAKKRKGKENFVSCMRQSLDHYYGNIKTVGIGGVFLIEKGQAKLHVMVGYLAFLIPFSFQLYINV